MLRVVHHSLNVRVKLYAEVKVTREWSHLLRCNTVTWHAISLKPDLYAVTCRFAGDAEFAVILAGLFLGIFLQVKVTGIWASL